MILGFMATACRAPAKETRSQLPVIFPDAARALGPFAIHLEKSRESNTLSAARVKVEQGETGKHITVQIKMIRIQEHVTLSFLHQSQPLQRMKATQGTDGDQGIEHLSQGNRSSKQAEDRETAQSVQEDSFHDPNGSLTEGTLSASRCTSSTSWLADSVALPSEHRAPPLQDAAALFHLPLPRSVREATSLQVTGAGDTWSIFNDALVWHPKKVKSSEIALSWERQDIPETRYPLQVKTRPRNLKARVIQDSEGTVINVDWHDGSVAVDAADVKAGAWLELQYDIEDTSTSLLLPQIPAFATMNILSFQNNCPREAFLLERDSLSWNCLLEKGALWAVSYSFRQPQDAWDFHDWPELSREAPASFKAVDDDGETIDVVMDREGRVLPKSPPDAAHICLQASWFSDRPR